MNRTLFFSPLAIEKSAICNPKFQISNDLTPTSSEALLQPTPLSSMPFALCENPVFFLLKKKFT
jgi:hypothetical protein